MHLFDDVCPSPLIRPFPFWHCVYERCVFFDRLCLSHQIYTSKVLEVEFLDESLSSWPAAVVELSLLTACSAVQTADSLLHRVSFLPKLADQQGSVNMVKYFKVLQRPYSVLVRNAVGSTDAWLCVSFIPEGRSCVLTASFQATQHVARSVREGRRLHRALGPPWKTEQSVSVFALN